MKYYLHDTSSFDDEKIAELFINFKYEGLGLFYTFLEKIGKQEKPVKTLILKSQLKVGRKLEKCWRFMEQIGLISSINGESFNNNLLNFSESYNIKKQKTREKVAEWRENQKDKNNVTGYVPISNSSKVKESKVKESKIKEIQLKKEIKEKKSFLQKPKKVFVPPTLDEVKIFFSEKGYTENSAVTAFNHYNLANWHDVNGKQVLNWKQKMNTVWFKDENKIKQTNEITQMTRRQFYDIHPDELQRVGKIFDDIPENVWACIEKREKIKFI